MATRMIALALAVGTLLVGPGAAPAATNPWVALGVTEPSTGVCGKQGEALVRGAGVHDVLRVGSDLYVSGCFTDWAGIAEADYIAKWNGTAWSALGSNGAGDGALDRVVYDIVEYNGGVAVGGEFSDAGGVAEADMIATWNGSTWAALPVAVGVSPRNGPTDYVSALYADGGTLYVGGAFGGGLGSGGLVANSANFAVWDGASWLAAGSPTPYAAYPSSQLVPQAILKIGTDLYIGAAYYGYFSCSESCAALRLPNALAIRASGGTWSNPSGWSAAAPAGTFGAGIGVFALAADGSHLYVGGNFQNVGAESGADYLAKMTMASSSWSGVSSFVPAYGTGAVISDLAEAGGTLYVAGSFPSAAPGVGSAAAMLTLSGWQGLGSAPIGSSPVPSAYAIDVDPVGGDVLVGGGFADAGGVAAADGIALFHRTSQSGFDVAIDSGSPEYSPIGPVPAGGDGGYFYVDAFQTASARCDRAYTITPVDLGASVFYDFGGGGWQSIAENRFAVTEYVNIVAPGSPVTITLRVRASDGTSETTRTMRVVCSRSQTITFDELADQSIATRTLTLGASATSALAPTYRSATPLVCSVAGAVVTFRSTGTCTITAAQAGSDVWAPAQEVSRSFRIGGAPAPQVAPAKPRLRQPVIRARRITVSFATAAGVSYTMRATSAGRVRIGSCVVTGATGSCVVRVLKGTWRVAVTPTRRGIKGAAATTIVTVR